MQLEIGVSDVLAGVKGECIGLRIDRWERPIRFVARNQRKACWRTALPDESRQSRSPPCDLSVVSSQYPASSARLASLSLACHRSFHRDFHAHPRVDAALKKMLAFR